MKNKGLSILIACLLMIIPCNNYSIEEQSSAAKKIGWIALAGAVLVGGYAAYKKIVSYIKERPKLAFLDAAQKNDCFMITKLLRDGIDVNVTDSNGKTALIFAAQKGHVEAVKCLLNNPQIKIDQQDNFGSTALMFAAQENKCSIINILLENGADINKSNLNGNTALMFAATEGHTDAVQCLLVNPNITINQQNKAGITALILAVTVDNCSNINVLLENGADINKSTLNGNTALIRAVDEENSNGVQCLLNDPNIIIDQQNKHGETPLLLAIYKKNKVIIKQLLDAGADPELNDKTGLTPRDLAIRVIYPKGYREAVFSNPFATNPPRRLNVPVEIQSDAEILSLINKAILKKHRVVNPFTYTTVSEPSVD